MTAFTNSSRSIHPKIVKMTGREKGQAQERREKARQEKDGGASQHRSV